MPHRVDSDQQQSLIAINPSDNGMLDQQRPNILMAIFNKLNRPFANV